MQEIYKDGTTQEVFFDAVSSDPELGAFVGSANGQALSGATVAAREYKKPTVSMTSPVIAWDNTLKKWKLNIPAAYVTQYGHVQHPRPGDQRSPGGPQLDHPPRCSCCLHVRPCQ
mgnify:CR=1 FL=1